MQGQKCENVFHIYRPNSAWDLTSMGVAAGKLRDWWVAHPGIYVEQSVTIDMIVATDQTSKTAPRLEYAAGLPLLGSNIGNPLPNNVTVAISWRTALRGRSYRGRTYHPGLTDTLVENSNLVAGANALLAAAYTQLLTELNDADHQVCVCSRYNEGAWRVAGVATPITGVTVDNNIDSQRKRLVQRGK
jgi:hypothetical protein